MKSAKSCLLIWLVCFASTSVRSETQFEIFCTIENYGQDNILNGTLTELLAAKGDLDACIHWEPSKAPLMPMQDIVSSAAKHLETPDRNFVWAKPKLVGMDLRKMGMVWVWKLHFYFQIDNAVKSQALIKHDGLPATAYLLPNGGKVVQRKREMTPEERAHHGIGRPQLRPQ